MDKLKFTKVADNKWTCTSPHGNYKVFIERRGWFYNATLYACLDTRNVAKFNFPPKFHLADMKEQIRNNSLMIDDEIKIPKIPGVYMPKSRYQPEPEECWWND